MPSRVRAALLAAAFLLPAIAVLTGSAFTEPALAGPCITDDMGETVCLEAPATRVVPLYAAFTDIFNAMGIADRIVGRTKTDMGADTKAGTGPGVPSIGTHMRPNAELVLGLKPDLALQMGGRAEAAKSVADLRRLGIPTAFFQVRTFADLFSVIERTGTLTGSPEAARALVASLQARLAALEKTLATGPASPGVFFEVRYPNLLGAGPDSMVTDIIRAAGGRNVLAEPGTARAGRIVRLSEEELLRLNPDVYCVQTGPMNKRPLPLSERPHFTGLRAVAAGRVLHVDERMFSRPGPNAVDAAEALARFLHPGLFPSSQEQSKP